MLDADKLLPAGAQAPKDLNLGCESPHQASRRRPEGGKRCTVKVSDYAICEPPGRNVEDCPFPS
jgi:hypothetical protein